MEVWVEDDKSTPNPRVNRLEKSVRPVAVAVETVLNVRCFYSKEHRQEVETAKSSQLYDPSQACFLKECLFNRRPNLV